MARLLVMRARSVDRWIRRLAVVAALAAGIAALAVAGAGSDSTALAAQVEIKDPLPVALGLLVPTLSPTIHNAAHEAVTSVPVDAPVHGRARVTGSGATPTGTVAYAWYDNATCSGGLLAGSTEPLISGVAHETSTFRPRIAVAHSLRVSYLGDSRYGAVMKCLRFSVSKISPTMVVEVHDANHNKVSGVFIYQQFHVNVSMDGPVWVDGTVTFTISAEADCSPSESGGSTVLSGEEAESGPFSSETARNLYVRARYLGSAAYLAKAGPCQKVRIDRRFPTITLAAHDSAHVAVTEPVKLQTKLHMSFKVSGTVGQAGGIVDLVTFSDAACNDITDQVSRALTAGAFDAYVSELRTVFGAPTDSYWRVYYRGDDSYQGGFSPCLKVSWRAPLSLQLQVHDPSHVVVSAVPQGTKVHADVTIAGPYPDTDGLVEVRSYADAACTAGMASSGNRALQDGHVDVTDFERTTTSGTARSFRATYTAWNVSDYLSGTGPCIAVAIIASATTAPPTSPPQGTPTPGPTGVAASPSSSQPPPTPEPAGSAPTASGTPGPSAPASPVGTGTPASPPPTTGQPPPSGPDPTPGAGPVDPSAAGGGFDPMLLIVTVVVAVVAVGSFLLGRRQRGGPAPKPPA